NQEMWRENSGININAHHAYGVDSMDNLPPVPGGNENDHANARKQSSVPQRKASVQQNDVHSKANVPKQSSLEPEEDLAALFEQQERNKGERERVKLFFFFSAQSQKIDNRNTVTAKDNKQATQPANGITGREFNKKITVEKTKFGNEKYVTTWTYLGSDHHAHSVVLRHNVKTGKQGKSKRVVLVDNVEKYSDKSNETKFFIKTGNDNLQIEIITNKDTGFKYELSINGENFENVKRDFVRQNHK
ncbi:hypothetical protein RFI_32743, partial [Reticulomyxa filosa]